MAEQEIFEARLRTALARRVADGPTDFDALEFARSVAAASPRRHGRATVRAGSLVGFPLGRRPAVRLAWALAAAALLIAATISAVYVGSELLRRSTELTVVPPPTMEMTIPVAPGELSSIAWSPDGTSVAVAANDGTVKILDTTTGDEALSLHHDPSPDPYAAPLAVEYSPDGTRITVGSSVYDATSGDALVTLRDAFPEDDLDGLLAYSPDGTRIGALLDLAWGVHIHILDAATGGDLLLVGKSWGASYRAPWSMAWSPDGTRIAIACGSDIEVWDVMASDNKLFEISSWFVVTDVAWSPDGTRIAATGGQGTGVWDATFGDEVIAIGRDRQEDRPLAGSADGLPRATDVAWSPDGTRLATAGHDGMTRILDAATGGELTTMSGHTGPLADVAWSPDGARIATAGSDGIVRIRQVPAAADDPPRR